MAGRRRRLDSNGSCLGSTIGLILSVLFVGFVLITVIALANKAIKDHPTEALWLGGGAIAVIIICVVVHNVFFSTPYEIQRRILKRKAFFHDLRIIGTGVGIIVLISVAWGTFQSMSVTVRWLVGALIGLVVLL